MTPNLLIALATLRNDALVIAGATHGAAARISLNFAVEIGQKLDVVDRLSRVDADYASENERDFAGDAYEAELGQPIDLLYGFSAGVQEVDFVPVAGLVVQAKGLGISAEAVLDGEASLN